MLKEKLTCNDIAFLFFIPTVLTKFHSLYRYWRTESKELEIWSYMLLPPVRWMRCSMTFGMSNDRIFCLCSRHIWMDLILVIAFYLFFFALCVCGTNIRSTFGYLGMWSALWLSKNSIERFNGHWIPWFVSTSILSLIIGRARLMMLFIYSLVLFENMVFSFGERMNLIGW